jgi:anaerobic selenocysteine-containing dehydrogenase
VHQGLALRRAQLPPRAGADAAEAGRPQGQRPVRAVGWDEALDTVAARLAAIAARDPQAAILPYSYAGTMGLVQGESMAARFFHKLGASLLDRTICSSAGGEALVATYGGKLGMHLEHLRHSRS